MSKETKKVSSSERQAFQVAQKKPYKKPEFTEWGSVFDLTQGPLTMKPDFPKGTVGA